MTGSDGGFTRISPKALIAHHQERSLLFRTRTWHAMRRCGGGRVNLDGLWLLGAEIADAARHAQKIGRVYFMHDPAGRLLKIGFTRNLAKRLSGVRSASGRDVVLLGSLPGTREIERQWHKRYARLREPGEWFRATPALLAAIASSLSVPPTGDDR